ncbi:MAG TPA: hypothetical protein VFE15_08605 [Marmoricola sp.]|nr:hypothetical protein [Marmoricola sp.]
MSATDYIIDILLIAIVVLQMRPSELTWRAVLRPVALVSIAGFHYLRGVHLAGNDVALIVTLTAVGVLFGTASAVATSVWRNHEGTVIARAGIAAAALWVAGMGFRFAFSIYSNSNAGGMHIASFSQSHDITSAQVWVTALVLMAFGEVLARTGLLQWRAFRLRTSAGVAPADRALA